MEKKLRTAVDIIGRDPAVLHVSGFTGGGGGFGGGANTAQLFIDLKPLSQRRINSEQVIARLRQALARGLTGGQLFLQVVQDIRSGGRQSNAQYQYTILADDLDQLTIWAPRITEALKQLPELEDVNSDRQVNGLDVKLNVDRATAAKLGINLTNIDNTLYDAFGQRQVSTIYNDMNQYHVVMEVEPSFWQNPDTLKQVWISTSGGALSGTQSSAAAVGAFAAGASSASSSTAGTSGSVPGNTTGVKSQTGLPNSSGLASGASAVSAATAAASSTSSATSAAARNQQLNALTNSGRGAASTGASVSTSAETMVPLAAVANYAPGLTPMSISHQGPFVATTISFNLPVGESLGTATAAIQRTMDSLHAPIGVHGTLAGTAQVFQQTQSNEFYLILAAIAAVYVVLGILYESYMHPITILSTLPSGGVGALLALLLFNTEFSLIALIGVILLIGIVKKNAIIMIDVAITTQRERQLDARTAIYDACLLRFRPIMMTTFAALFGALPLALTTGNGAELRQPLGISIVGGLLLSQILTLYTTPVVYMYLDRFRLWMRTITAAAPRSIDWSVTTKSNMKQLSIVSTTPSTRSRPRSHRRRCSRAATLLPLLLALDACAVGPKYRRPAVETAPVFKENQGWEPASPAPIPAGQPWWSIYNDPVLDRLEQQVVISNQNLKAAEAAFRAAQQVVAADRGSLFPQINATGSATKSGGGTGITTTSTGTAVPRAHGSTETVYSAGAQATWSLDIWGRIRRQVESDVAKAQASAADVTAAELSAQVTLAEDYFQLRAAEQEMRIYQTYLSDLENALQITENQVAAGITTLADVYGAQTQLESTQAADNTVRVTRATFEHAIAVLIGKPPAELSLERG